ncbi:unnamed protein product [Polarella glacialis]|uniref:Tyrosine-protein kinase ephrin type A/B receptor-like domain-containing protein n=1 Tax=Polarella glacialis TaxID=89957 RepID=A0A813J407_POLGL|nr:unnamed protein product [Polarella glacialis]
MSGSGVLCLSCQPGRYSSSSGSDQCYPCEAGRAAAKLAGAVVESGRSSCEDCVAGTAARPGSLQCEICPEGSFAGAVQENCDRCPNGTSAPANSSQCEACVAGRFARIGFGSCLLCEGGRSSGPNSSTSIQCPAGHFAMPGSAPCKKCPNGTAAAPGSVQCSKCSPGSTPEDIEQRFCGQCMAGTAAYTNSSVCQTCSVGRFAAPGSKECAECAAGRWAENLSSFCTLCDPGKFAGPGSASCEFCEPGKASLSGKAECTPCQPGSFSAAGADHCGVCSPGQFAKSGGQCEDCPVGKFSGLEGSISCEMCLPGTAAGHGQASCDICPSGTSSLAGQGNCTVCPAGKAAVGQSAECEVCSSGRAAKSRSKSCEECLQGYFAVPASPICSPCPAGTRAAVDKGGCETCQAGRFAAASSILCRACPRGSVTEVAGKGGCKLCPLGRYQQAEAMTSCDLCPTGRYNDTGGSTSQDDCAECDGKATLGPGANGSEHCIRPEVNQTFRCFSGRSCAVAGIRGQGLQPMQHYGLVANESCGNAASAVPGFPGMKGGLVGVSEAGSTSLTWQPGVLTAFGGVFQLCWCSNLRPGLDCGQAAHFDFQIGLLEVIGPFPGQHFSCVRGRGCRNLGPLLGHGLSEADGLRLQTSCSQEGEAVSLSSAGPRPENSFTLAGELRFGFGSEPAQAPASSDYVLCWCSGGGGRCPGDFLATAGIFMLSGPTGGQQMTCDLGQSCVIRGMQGVGLQDGDKITVQETCGDSRFLDGLPGDAIAKTNNGKDFDFYESNPVLKSLPGIFHLCWCQPQGSGENECASGADFAAIAGLFIAGGPYPGQSHTCTVNEACSLSLRGVGLQPGDQVMLLSRCGDASAVLVAATGPWAKAKIAEGPDGAHYELQGQNALGSDGVPRQAELCWCPVHGDCSDPRNFAALAAVLDVGCPPGFYRLIGKPPAQDSCRICHRGSFCTGGFLNTLPSRCPSTAATRLQGASAKSNCTCNVGYAYHPPSQTCIACSEGSFKHVSGNLEKCLGQCPQGTTSLPAAGSVTDCYCSAGMFDADPSPTEFNCAAYSADVFDGNPTLATVEAIAYTMNVSMRLTLGARSLVDKEYLNKFLSELRSGLFLHPDEVLEIQLSTETRRLGGGSSGFTGAEARPLCATPSRLLKGQDLPAILVVTGSQLARFDELADALEPQSFAAWVQQLGSESSLAGLEVVNSSNVSNVTLRCPEGLAFPPGSRSVSLDECSCSHGWEVTGMGCQKCPVGTYKSSVGDFVCDACPEHRLLTTIKEGQLSKVACVCQPGTYPSGLDKESIAMCKLCPKNNFCTGGDASSSSCPENTETMGEGAAISRECLCSAGFMNSAGHLAVQIPGVGAVQGELGPCAACPPGWIKASPGEEPCLPCDPGQASNVSTCESCPPGKYSLKASSNCTECSAGEFQDKKQQDRCSLCRDGIVIDTEQSAGLAPRTRPTPVIWRSAFANKISCTRVVRACHALLGAIASRE